MNGRESMHNELLYHWARGPWWSGGSGGRPGIWGSAGARMMYRPRRSCIGLYEVLRWAPMRPWNEAYVTFHVSGKGGHSKKTSLIHENCFNTI